MIYGKFVSHHISSISLLLYFVVLTPISLALAQEEVSVVEIVPNALDKAKSYSQVGPLLSEPYYPQELDVAAGETVIWVNNDTVPHTVTSGKLEYEWVNNDTLSHFLSPDSRYLVPDGIFDSGHINPNERFNYTFNIKGNFSYYDTLNPEIRGTIRVDQDIEQRDEPDRDEPDRNESSSGPLSDLARSFKG